MVPHLVAEFDSLEDARLFREAKNEHFEAHICAGVSRRWGVTVMMESRSVYEVPHIDMLARQAN